MHFFFHIYTAQIIIEKIFFYLPAFNSVARKLFLGRKNIGEAFASSSMPQVMPIHCVNIYTTHKFGLQLLRLKRFTGIKKQIYINTDYFTI